MAHPDNAATEFDLATLIQVLRRVYWHGNATLIGQAGERSATLQKKNALRQLPLPAGGAIWPEAIFYRRSEIGLAGLELTLYGYRMRRRHTGAPDGITLFSLKRPNLFQRIWQRHPLLALSIRIDVNRITLEFQPATTRQYHGTLDWIVHLDAQQQMALERCYAQALANQDSA